MYRSTRKRRATFTDASLAVEQWADTGFYQDDTIFKCFYCDLIRHQLVGDNPWLEHYRWNPFCPYVLIRRGRLTFEANTCVVCLTRQRETVFLPCRHAVACVHCVATLANQCPMCRQHIGMVWRIFIT